MAWHVCAAAAIGRSHVDGGLPCQDAFAFDRVGDALIAVVCDGAGSQPRSHEGAQSVSADVVATLARAETVSPEVFVAAIASARAALEARGGVLSEFAATLVGAYLHRDGGWFFHVGDGVAVACNTDGASTVSLPENGEYANETFFVTGEGWESHVRVMQVAGPIASVALMSDGAMPFAMAKDLSSPFMPFFEPVSRYLACVDEATGSQALLGTLLDPRTDTITSDDKTLLVAQWR